MVTSPLGLKARVGSLIHAWRRRKFLEEVKKLFNEFLNNGIDFSELQILA